MKNCTSCGAQMADNATFCPNCGASQHSYTPPASGYHAPQGNPNPAGGYNAGGYSGGGYNAGVPRTPVKTDYNLLTYILLTILTCGIYGYYTIYKLAQDVNQICAEDGDSLNGLGMYILLSIVTCGFYSYYWLYKLQNRLYAAGPRYNVHIAEDGGKVLLWIVVGALICGIGSFVGYNIVFKSANAVGTAYNARYFYNHPQY